MKKRWFSLLLAAVMVLSLLPVGALAADAADLKYTIADGVVTITGCDPARGDLIIPATIEGKPVRAIGASAFDGCAYLTSVVLPEGLTSIGTRAFASCERMERINLPTTLKSIGTGAFLTCVSLKSISLPDGLKTLSPYAFSVCESLEAVTIPEGVTTIEHDSFYGCSGLKKVTIPSGVSAVGTQAFSACRKLTEIEIKNAATKFEDDAFSNCASLLHVFYAGTEQQWSAAGGEFVGLNPRVFLHFGIRDSRGHIQTLHFDPTPAHPGYDAWECGCGYHQLSSSVVYVGEDGMTAAITERTDLQFAGAATEPASEAQEAALRSQSGRNVLHFFRAVFSEADAALPISRAVIELPVPEDVYPDSIRAFTVAEEISEVRAVLSADQTTITLTVDTPCEFCIAGRSNAHVHQLAAVERIEPTCTEPGAEAYWKCTECGMLFSDAEGAEEIAAPAEIPAKGHHFEVNNAKEATCAEPGYTGDRICSDCGKVGAVGETIPTLEHEAERKNAKAATCAEPGYTGDLICKNCGEVLSVGEVIPTLEHVAERKNARAATCAEPGYTGDLICRNCGKVLSVGEVIPSPEHETELKNARAATCAEPGYTGDLICKNCGKVIEQGKVIPMLDHETELRSASEPTCTREGYTGDQICRNCGKVIEQGKVIPMLDHETELKNARAATCSAAGYTGDQICQNCGKVISKGEAIPMLDHETELRSASEPTCTREGYTGDEICKTCGKVVSMGEAIPALGHSPTLQNAKKAACTEDGYTGDEICTVCGETLKKGEVIPAAGHSWGEWAVTKPATEEAEGVETRACSACGAVETRAIPKVIPAPANPFTDGPEGAYFYDAVLWAVGHEPQITNGTGADRFSPKAVCTRGQVVTFLWRAMGCPEPTSTTNPFTDVKPSDYFYKAVLWAVEQNITNGTDDQHFDPEGSCTRAHVVTFLWRAHGKPAAEGSNPFVDVPAGQYYTDAVLWAVSEGITNGIDDKHFGPKELCTRGQVVTFLWRDLGD